MSIKTTSERPATVPTIGAARDGILAALAGFVTAWIYKQTGDADVAHAGGQAASQSAPLVLGGIVTAITLVRKWSYDKLAARK